MEWTKHNEWGIIRKHAHMMKKRDSSIRLFTETNDSFCHGRDLEIPHLSPSLPGDKALESGQLMIARKIPGTLVSSTPSTVSPFYGTRISYLFLVHLSGPFYFIFLQFCGGEGSVAVAVGETARSVPDGCSGQICSSRQGHI